MPRGDGTGPQGFGPMTGRGAGFCAGFPVPGYQNTPGWGAGRSGGWGGGGGRRRWCYRMPMPYPAAYDPGYAPAATSSEAELGLLKGEVSRLKGLLSEINARIRELSPKEEAE
ncbi:MAG: DUF5320 domain-containing protein [Limnochordia bacterium]|jgi:hypothetical protein